MATLNGAYSRYAFLDDKGLLEDRTKPIPHSRDLDLEESIQAAGVYLSAFLKADPQDVSGFCLFHSLLGRSTTKHKFYFAANAADILTPRKVQRLTARLKKIPGKDAISANIREKGALLEKSFAEREKAVGLILQLPKDFFEERVIFLNDNDGVIDLKTGALLLPAPLKPRGRLKAVRANVEKGSTAAPQ